MRTVQKSLRIPGEIAKAIEESAEASGRDFTAVANELLVEATKMRRCPGILFAGGPGGRRAIIAGTGLAVWEVLAAYESLGRNVRRLKRAYHWLSESQLRAALGYAGAYPEEITRQIARNEKWTRDRLAKEHPTLAAGPRWGTTWITIHAFNAHEAHHGVLLVSHRLPGDRFALLARALADYAARHPRGLPRYTVDFL